MTKYHVTALVVGTAYVGKIEAHSREELKEKLVAKKAELKGKSIKSRDLDEDILDFDAIEANVHDGVEYLPAKWR